jgi:hypothetical protein
LSAPHAGSSATSWAAAYRRSVSSGRGEGDFLPDGLADRVVDRQPAPLAAEVDLAAGRLDDPTAQCVGHAEVEVADQAGDGGLVAVGLVGLQHGELGRVGGVDPSLRKMRPIS